MAHYAFLDENNIVTEVIPGIDETELIEGLDPETWYGNFRGQKCKRTSYNGNIRKNFAGIGFTYDEDFDAFIAPRPYTSWKLNYTTYTWEAPILMPDPEEGHVWKWSEINKEWIKLAIPTEEETI
jgi:hypothetical protein